MVQSGGGNLRIAVDTAGAADVDNDALLAVLNAEVRGSELDKLKGGSGVDRNHGVPLLVREL